MRAIVLASVYNLKDLFMSLFVPSAPSIISYLALNDVYTKTTNIFLIFLDPLYLSFHWQGAWRSCGFVLLWFEEELWGFVIWDSSPICEMLSKVLLSEFISSFWGVRVMTVHMKYLTCRKTCTLQLSILHCIYLNSDLKLRFLLVWQLQHLSVW